MRYSRMLDVVLSNRFKKDLKLAAKRGLDLDAPVSYTHLTLPTKA